MKFEPCYISTYNNGRLKEKIESALRMLSSCQLCARSCGVDRTSSTGGTCRTGRLARVASFFAHFGEEGCLRGRRGSGTIFFSQCNLRCSFCQNYETSHTNEGTQVTPAELARIMLYLQGMGCHNINFVTPSHVVAQILEALPYAIAEGLRLPLVYNTGCYDALETIRLLEGVIDIYMPDFKFWDPEVAGRLAEAPDYPEVARKAIKEMHLQVGDLQLDEDGIALRGLLVRHLVMPEGLAGTPQIVRFLASLSKRTYINIMGQYYPAGEAYRYPELSRRISRKEFLAAYQAAKDAGLHRFAD